MTDTTKILVGIAIAYTLLTLSGFMTYLNSRLYRKNTIATHEKILDICAYGVENRYLLRTLNDKISSNTEETITYLKILVIQPDIEIKLAKKIARAVTEVAHFTKKDPDLILAIIKGESNFRPESVSSVGAVGLMQIFPSWSKTACSELDLKDVYDNIKCGVRVYSFYEEQYKDIKTILTVYNRGPNPVDHALAAGKDPSNGYAKKIQGIYSKLQSLH